MPGSSHLSKHRRTTSQVDKEENILTHRGMQCMNHFAEEFVGLVAETSTPEAMSEHEVEEESRVDPV